MPTPTMQQFRTVKADFCFVRNHRPLSCHNHSIGGRASVATLADTEHFWERDRNSQLNQLPKRAPINPSKRLKLGTASANIQADSQVAAQMAHQLLKLFQLFVCTTLVPVHTLK
jgi:glycyl-tRNA synthetase beta subunit